MTVSPVLTIAYHPTDAALAHQIQADAARLSAPAAALVAVLSPQAVNDPGVLHAIDQALDQNQAVVPVLAQPTRLPRLIEHLEALDLSAGYDFDALAARVAQENNPDALRLRVRTSHVQKSNRRAGYIVAAAALIMFLAGLYGVGVLGISAPPEEYNAVETEIVQTRDSYIEAALPRSTEDAANFQATVNAAASTLRPLLVATATAQAAVTPTPEN